MSTQAQALPTAIPSPSGSPVPTQHRRKPWAVVILIIISLVASTLLQQHALDYRTAAVNRNLPKGTPAPARVANLDSFSLALLLGGLRGPLVMYLWSSSETQKADKDLDSFDSKVELIRLLQPEFDSVHLFQMWNKAYNVSVQMASLGNKYGCILDAVEYGRRADRGNPYSINIITSIGSLYADKLGGAAEKDYYRRRVRTETLPVYVVRFAATHKPAFLRALADAGISADKVRLREDGAQLQCVLDKFAGDRVKWKLGPAAQGYTFAPARRQDLRPAGAGRVDELDTMLSVDGAILPDLLKPLRDVPPGKELNDGSELQYLAPFQPFKYGLSPIALGYNYFKKGQVLYVESKQRHLQWSDMVVDSHPAVALRSWADEETDRARRAETRALGTVPGTEQFPRDLHTAALGPDVKVLDDPAVEEALFSFDRAGVVADAAVREYERHMKSFTQLFQNNQLHIDTLKAQKLLTAGDAAYLRAIAAKNETSRKEHLAAARDQYLKARRGYQLLVLKYYVLDGIAMKLGYSKATVDEKSVAEVLDLTKRLDVAIKAEYGHVQNDPFYGDRLDYNPMLDRIDARLKLLR